MIKYVWIICFAIVPVFFCYSAERQVDFVVADGSITIAGTLAIPDSIECHDYIVLISGSGAQNRDEEVARHRPFKVLSDRLVADGYGVLRIDDRGVGGSTGDSSTATIADIVGDIEAAMIFLRQTDPEIHRIGLLGHSLGGLVAVRLAAQGKADFIITLAAPAIPGDELIMQQSRAIAVAMTGKWDNEQLQRRLLDVAKSQQYDYIARGIMYTYLLDQVGDAINIPSVQDDITKQIDGMLSPFYRDMLRYDPRNDIGVVSVPWLAVNGICDIQVDVSNLDTIKSINQRPTVTVKKIEGHNHLLQICSTGMVDEYYRLGQSPSDTALDIITTWLNGISKN